MTENEAIKIIRLKACNDRCTEIHCDDSCMYGEGQCAFQMAIKVLDEIQQYRAIGTIEVCRAAVEKQVAKKPSYEGDGYYNGELVYDTWICPCCEKHYEVDYEEYDFCPNCGQHIDHSVLTEDD